MTVRPGRSASQGPGPVSGRQVNPSASGGMVPDRTGQVRGWPAGRSLIEHFQVGQRLVRLRPDRDEGKRGRYQRRGAREQETQRVRAAQRVERDLVQRD